MINNPKQLTPSLMGTIGPVQGTGGQTQDLSELFTLNLAGMTSLELARLARRLEGLRLDQSTSPLIFGIGVRLLRSESQLERALAKRLLRKLAIGDPTYGLHLARALAGAS